MRSAKDLGLLFKMDTSLFDKRSGSRGAPVAALASNRRNFWYF